MPSVRLLVAGAVVPLIMMLCAQSAHAAPIHDPFETAVVERINTLRAQNGVAPLHADRRLARSAGRHSRDQLRHDALSHNAGNGTPFSVRMARLARNRLVGENVAFLPDGMSDRAARVVQMWMDSPGHRAQLLRPRYARVGIGRWYGSLGPRRPGLVITANFASRR